MPTHCWRIVSINGETALFSLIYRENVTRIEVFLRRVREGRDVMAASEFARWLLGSGILTLLQSHANDCSGPLKVDGAFLRWKTDELLDQCNEFFRSYGCASGISPPELESVHEKLAKVSSNVEVLAFQVAKHTAALGSEDSGGTETIRHSMPESAVPLPFLSYYGALSETAGCCRAAAASAVSLIKG